VVAVRAVAAYQAVVLATAEPAAGAVEAVAGEAEDRRAL